jgi:hypothetical protein
MENDLGQSNFLNKLTGVAMLLQICQWFRATTLINCQVDDAGGSMPVDGGLVMNDITHQGHRFADEVCVIGFWIEWQEKHYDPAQPLGKPFSVETKSAFYDPTHLLDQR